MSDQLKKLRAPFPDNQISLLPKPTNKDNKKGSCHECGGWHGLPAVHLKYVGHAALTDRLLDVDPLWFWEPVAFTPQGLPAFDHIGGLWIRLTVCGHTRLGYGNAADGSFKDVGAREKEVIGDALRNAAMRFGAALDLWHKGDLHGTDTDEADAPAAKAPQAKQVTSVVHMKPAQAIVEQNKQAQAINEPTGALFADTYEHPQFETNAPLIQSSVEFSPDYVIKIGKYKGRRMLDIDPNELISYRDWMKSQEPVKKRPMTGDSLEFYNQSLLLYPNSNN